MAIINKGWTSLPAIYQEKLIVMRPPRTKRERMIAALRSTDDDLYPDSNGRVVVAGKNLDDELLYLGEFSESLLYEKGASPRSVIDRIRFSVERKD
jgi:hypothetical protein